MNRKHGISAVGVVILVLALVFSRKCGHDWTTTRVDMPAPFDILCLKCGYGIGDYRECGKCGIRLHKKHLRGAENWCEWVYKQERN